MSFINQPMGNSPHSSHQNNNVELPLHQMENKWIKSLSVRAGKGSDKKIIPETHLKTPFLKLGYVLSLCLDPGPWEELWRFE